MDRPRRALIEEPEDERDEPAVRYIPRRSGGFVPDDQPVRGRRALLPDPDEDDPTEPEDDAEAVAEADRAEPAPESEPAPEPEPATPSADAVAADDDEDDEGPDDEPPPRPRRAWVEPDTSAAPAPRLGAPTPPVAAPVTSAPAAGVTPIPPAPTSPERPTSPTTPVRVPSTPALPLATATSAASPGSPPLTMPLPPAPLASLTHPIEPIRIHRLVKSFEGTLAVRNLSFTVEPGRITGFLGPNGAGKTTTLRILVGLVAPTTGSATFGRTAYADLPHPQQTVGCVLDAGVHPGRSGRNHLRVLAATAGASDRRVDQLLERVGLTSAARQPAGRYSLGMKQRLALAGALLGDPDYLVLDEPANGLDPEGIRWLRGFLREFAASGRTVLISSHLLNEVQATADDIVVINQGRLLAQLPISELNLGSGTVRARTSDNDLAVRALARIDAAVERGYDDQGAYLRVHSNEVAAIGTALFQAGVVVHELITERRDLEQEFFAMLEASA